MLYKKVPLPFTKKYGFCSVVLYNGQCACHPQRSLYMPNCEGTDIKVILRFTRDTQLAIEPGLPACHVDVTGQRHKGTTQ